MRRRTTRILAGLLLSASLAWWSGDLLPGIGTAEVRAQAPTPGIRSSVGIRSRPRVQEDRWPLMFTWSRNKVNWWELDWRISDLPYTTLYYYQEAEPVARMASRMIVESDSLLQAVFDYDLQAFTADKTIPKVIYTSHHTFEQTNTIAQQVPEGVLGFTEFTKGRVVFPYSTGNADFRHVLEHENTHIHMIHKIKHVFKSHGIYDTSKILPALWFSEGLAEFSSVGRDPVTGGHRMDRETEMYLRDAVLNGTMPTIKEMRLYPDFAKAYKFGHALNQYLSARRGPDHFHEMLSNWHHIFANRNSYSFLKRRPLDTYDPLNPGVDHFDEPFLRIGDQDVPLVQEEDVWRARTAAGLVDTLEGEAVSDRVDRTENIELGGQWYRVVWDDEDTPGLYRPGEEVVYSWDDDTVAEVLHRAKKDYERIAYRHMSFDGLLAWWYDIKLPALSEEWREDIEGYYGPWLEGRTRMTELRPVGTSALDLFPSISRDGRLVLYKAYQRDYIYSLLVMDLETGARVQLARDIPPEVESLQVLAEGGDIWPLGEGRYRSLFTAQRRHRDVVYRQDLVRGPDGRLELDGEREIVYDPAPSTLVGISGVRFADGPDQILFSGLSLDGYQDLYVADLSQDRPARRLTRDLASDRMPVWWDDRVLFASDRASEPTDFAYHLFLLDPESGTMVQLSDGPGNEKNPWVTPDDARVYFESDASGVSNIYEWDGRNAPRQVSDVATGIFTPALIKPDTLLVAGFHDREFNLYELPIGEFHGPASGRVDTSFAIGADEPTPEGLLWVERPWDPDRVPSADRLAVGALPSRRYAPRFSLDNFYASSEFGGYQGYNAAVFGTEIRFSDILGEHIVGAALWNGPRDGLDDLSWVVSYWNQQARTKWGGAVYRTSGVYFNLVRQDFYLRERAGVNYQLNYPFNQFSDLNLIAGAATERRRLGTIDGSIDFREVELGLGYTRDVSSWGPQGPHRGWVFSAFYDHILDVTDPFDFDTFTAYLVADVRGYVPLHRYVVAAGRVAGGHSIGKEPEFFFLGGGFFLRGFWNLYDLYGSSYSLANTELRIQPLELMGIKPIRAFEQIGWPVQVALYAEAASTEWQGGRLGPLGSAGVSLRLTLMLPFVVEYAWYRRNFWENGPRGQEFLITLLF